MEEGKNGLETYAEHTSYNPLLAQRKQLLHIVIHHI
jgi:hypothetical protein